jgi:hypothetical protein
MRLGRKSVVDLILAACSLAAFCVVTFWVHAPLWRMPLLVSAALALTFAYTEREKG